MKTNNQILRDYFEFAICDNVSSLFELKNNEVYHIKLKKLNEQLAKMQVEHSFIFDVLQIIRK